MEVVCHDSRCWAVREINLLRCVIARSWAALIWIEGFELSQNVPDVEKSREYFEIPRGAEGAPCFFHNFRELHFYSSTNSSSV